MQVIAFMIQPRNRDLLSTNEMTTNELKNTILTLIMVTFSVFLYGDEVISDIDRDQQRGLVVHQSLQF